MKIAVIGCGKQGRRHLAAFAAIPGVSKLVAADLDSARSREAGVAAVSIAAVFADPSIASVVIATPTPAHLMLVRRAVAARKHFLCEKPFGANATEGYEIAHAASGAGIVGRVGYLYRFAPSIIGARDAMPGLGQIESARFAIAGPGNHAVWKHRRESGGGAINELASHMVDLANWFFGPHRDSVVLEKSQRHARRPIDGARIIADAEDRIVARLGDAVTITADFAAPRFSQSLEIRGEHGAIRASIEGAPDLYRRQAQAFLAAIAGDRTGDACDPIEAAQASAVLETMNRARRTVAAA